MNCHVIAQVGIKYEFETEHEVNRICSAVLLCYYCVTSTSFNQAYAQ